jgi:phosphate uptake regulator
VKRKIIQIAGSTCLVSLPREWIQRQGIKKGDEVEIDEQGSKVVVSTESHSAPQKMIISPDKFGRFYPHQLSAAYHLGFEDVEIVYSDKKTLSQVQDRITNCIGYEIVDQGDNFCRIKSISHASMDEFDQILRKIFLLLLSMGKNISDLLDKKEYSKLAEVKVLEVTNNKLTDFCKRVLNIQGYKEFNKLTTMYTIVTYLEMMADEYRDVCDHLSASKGRLSNDLLVDFKEVNEVFSLFYQSFYKFSGDNVEKVFEKGRPLKRRVVDKMSKTKGDDVIVLHAIGNIMTIIYELENANIEMNM